MFKVRGQHPCKLGCPDGARWIGTLLRMQFVLVIFVCSLANWAKFPNFSPMQGNFFLYNSTLCPAKIFASSPLLSMLFNNFLSTIINTFGTKINAMFVQNSASYTRLHPFAAQYLTVTSQLYNNLVCNCLRVPEGKKNFNKTPAQMQLSVFKVADDDFLGKEIESWSSKLVGSAWRNFSESDDVHDFESKASASRNCTLQLPPVRTLFGSRYVVWALPWFMCWNNSRKRCKIIKVGKWKEIRKTSSPVRSLYDDVVEMVWHLRVKIC